MIDPSKPPGTIINFSAAKKRRENRRAFAEAMADMTGEKAAALLARLIEERQSMEMA